MSIGNLPDNQLARLRISAALKALAPELAPYIADVFPFPHLDLFGLPSARMHLLGLAVVCLDPTAIDRDRLFAKRWADAATLVADPAPTGLEGVLSAMALPIWTAADYRTLLGLLSCPAAKRVLGHAQDVTPMLVGILEALPPQLRKVKFSRLLRSASEAKVLSALCNAPGAASRLDSAVSPSDTPKGLYDKLGSVLNRLDTFPAPPTVDHPDVTPVLDGHDLTRVAIEFANCLRDYRTPIVRGQIAFYALRGAEPAVVSIRPMIGGRHVIEEIRGANNTTLSKAAIARITQIFADAGFGRSPKEERRELGTHLIGELQTLGSEVRDVDAICARFLSASGSPGCA